MGLASTARNSFDSLYNLLQDVGFAISSKKLVERTTKVVCLGVFIDSAEVILSVPEEKLQQIKDIVKLWKNRTSCIRRQLQSLLGHLIYIHKCVKPSRFFIYRMLDLLRRQYGSNVIYLNYDFQEPEVIHQVSGRI